MSFSILQNTKYIGKNISTTLSAVNGSPPYSYSVESGGAGGVIDSNGKYTAPNNSGTDTIKAIDSLGAQVTVKIFVMDALKLLCNIIQTQLGLEHDQVYIYNTKFTIPEDDRLYIAIAILNTKFFGTKSEQKEINGDYTEVLSSHQADTLQIDIMSRTTEAMDKRKSVIRALRSVYSQQQQELNSIGIARLPTNFNAINEGDGAAIPYRYSGSVVVQYAEYETNEAPFYDSFQGPDVYTDPEQPDEPISVDIGV